MSKNSIKSILMFESKRNSSYPTYYLNRNQQHLDQEALNRALDLSRQNICCWGKEEAQATTWKAC